MEEWYTIGAHSEEELKQMFFEEGIEIGEQRGEQRGIKIGEQRGRQEGENLLATLINKLISLGRNDDITKVTTDQAFRENLYIQYGLKKSL